MSARATRDGAVVRVFSSFEEENETEHARWATLTPQERWDELAVLQRRAFGEKWTSEPMVKVARYEAVDW
jgi:hypothetical protein